MNEILQKLNALKADELEAVITRANIMLEKKRKDEAQQALLEKLRIRQEQLDQAQKRQQEIAELERKLKELKSQTPAVPEEVRGDSFVMREPAPAAQTRPANKICPRCNQSNTHDSMFCAGCGKQLTAK